MTDLHRIERPSHACVIFDRADEHLRVLAQHLADGLRVGRRAVALLDTVPPEDLARSLEAEGIDVAHQTALGALQFASAPATYAQGGSFHPDAMIQVVASKLLEARMAGYRGLCAAGEMTWALEPWPGAERLLEYEAKLNGTVFRSPDLVGLCTYDSRRFGTEMLRDIERVHPICVSTFRVLHELPAADGVLVDRRSEWRSLEGGRPAAESV